MTIFFPFSGDRSPPGSFVQPVAIPTSPPGAEKLLRVCFNDQWLKYVIGCLFQLTMNTTWDASNDTQLQGAIQAANDLILLFQKAIACTPDLIGTAGADTELMIRQDPDNPCLLQSSLDGVTWCTFADLSKCFQGSNAVQGGAGSEQPAPGGGCVRYEFALEASQQYLLPTIVNSGDVITLIDALGATNDSTLGTTWYCPDGQVFFAGACIGGPNFQGTAIVPGAPFMSPIVTVAGTSYDLSSPVTIPGGVVNQLATIQINVIPGHVPFGTLSMIVEVCNNAAATWSHTFDFTTDPGGWVADVASAQTLGFWTAGVGWTDGDAILGGNGYRGVLLNLTLPSTSEITGVSAIFDRTAGTVFASGDVHNIQLNGTLETTVPIQTAPPNPFTFLGDVTGVTLVEVDLYCGNDNTASDPGGTLKITSITLTGKGANPFGP